MVRKTKKTLEFSRRYLIITMAVFLILGTAALALRHNSPAASAPETGDSSAGTSPFSPTASNAQVNLNPPTQDQKNDGESHKNSITQKDDQIKDGGSPNSQATVVITEKSSTVIRAYISGVLEDGGTCTATATAPGQATVSASSTGFKNVSYTQCAPINWNLSSGDWTITLSYKSSSTTVSTSTKLSP
ncbi:hypothetical protein KW801_00795 [Candidatus Saccharibacteria bacterium]|nr:hypothetical protein [Candidatus Saccharibacteria bacterium]